MSCSSQSPSLDCSRDIFLNDGYELRMDAGHVRIGGAQETNCNYECAFKCTDIASTLNVHIIQRVKVNKKRH